MSTLINYGVLYETTIRRIVNEGFRLPEYKSLYDVYKNYVEKKTQLTKEDEEFLKLYPQIRY